MSGVLPFMRTGWYWEGFDLDDGRNQHSGDGNGANRELKNIGAQDLPNASINHPLSAKNAKEGKKGIFTGATNVNSAANLNAHAGNYAS